MIKSSENIKPQSEQPKNLIAKAKVFLATIFSKEKSRQFIREHLFNPAQSAQHKAVSIGFGVFMGIVPIWGFQLLTAFALAVLFRLNKALVILAAHISFAPLIPVIIFLSYKAGGLWVGNKNVDIRFDSHISLKSISLHLEQYLYGSISLAIVAGLAAGLLTFMLLRLTSRNNSPTT